MHALGLYRDKNANYNLGFRVLGPMINKPPQFKGLNIRIPIIILIKGRGFY